MYKYRFNNQIHIASDFREARGQKEFALPNYINPISHFIVRIWYWDENDSDFSIEIFDPPGYQVFSEFDDALTCFNNLASDQSVTTEEEIKLELVHYHRGKITTYRSKILFSPLLAGQL